MPPNTLYEPEPFLGYSFTEEDKERFRRYGMDVQNALDAGGTPEEISEAAKSIERDEQFKVERAEHPVQQSRPVAVPPLEDPNFDVHGVPQQYEGLTDPERYKMRGEAGDVGTALVQGLTSMFGTTVGFGMERLGEKYENQVLEDLGRTLKDTANKYVQSLGESMSPVGRGQGVGSRDFLVRKEGMEDRPWHDISSYEPGNFNLDTILQTMGSAAGSSIMPGGIAYKLGRGIQAVTKASPYVAGASSMAIAGGGLEGLSTASDVHDDAMRVPDEVIVKSPIFKTISQEVLKQHPDAQGSQLIDFTRKQIANQAAYESGLYSGAFIGVTSIPTGGFLGRVGILAKPEAGFRKGFINSIISGSSKEGVQEFFQEGGQQVAQNYGKYLIGENPEKWNFMGVPEAAVRGAVGGAGVGGVMGGVSRVATQADAPMAEMEEDILKEIDEETAAKEAQLEEEKELTDKAKVEEAKTKGKPQDQQVKDYEKETERASSINTKLSTLYKLREEGSLSRKAMNTSKLKWKQGDSFTKILKKNGFTEADVDAYGSPDTTFGIGDALESDEFILGEEKAPKGTTTPKETTPKETTTKETTPKETVTDKDADDLETMDKDLDELGETGGTTATQMPTESIDELKKATTGEAPTTTTPTVTAPTKPTFENKEDRQEFNKASQGLRTNKRNLEALEKLRREATDPKKIEEIDARIVDKNKKIEQSQKRVDAALAKGTVPEVAPTAETTTPKLTPSDTNIYGEEEFGTPPETRATTPPKFDERTDRNFAKALRYYDTYYDRNVEKSGGAEQAIKEAAARLVDPKGVETVKYADKIPKGVKAKDFIGPRQVKRGISTEGSLNILKRLGGSRFDTQGKKLNKVNAWEKILTIVHENKSGRILKEVSEQTELDVATVRGKTVEVKEDSIDKAVKAQVTQSRVSPEFKKKLVDRINELTHKENEGTLTEFERLQLEVAKRSQREVGQWDVGKQAAELEAERDLLIKDKQHKPEDVWGLMSGIARYNEWDAANIKYHDHKLNKKRLSDMKRAVKIQLEKLFERNRTAYTSNGFHTRWLQLFDPESKGYNPAAGELFLEWMKIEEMHSRVSSLPKDSPILDKNGDVVHIQHITSSHKVHENMKKALVERNKKITILNNARTNKVVELEDEYTKIKISWLKKVEDGKVTLEKAWKEIDGQATRLASEFKNSVKDHKAKAIKAEEKLHADALEYDYNVEVFKNDMIDVVDINDLRLENIEVAKEVRDLTNTMKALYHPDGSFIGMHGANVHAGRIIFTEVQDDTESWEAERLAEVGFNLKDAPPTKEEIMSAKEYGEAKILERALADLGFNMGDREEIIGGRFTGKNPSAGVEYDRAELKNHYNHNLRIFNAYKSKKIAGLSRKKASDLMLEGEINKEDKLVMEDISQERLDRMARTEKMALDSEITRIRLMAEELGIDSVDIEESEHLKWMVPSPLFLTGVRAKPLKVTGLTEYKPSKASYTGMKKSPVYRIQQGESTVGFPKWFLQEIGQVDQFGKVITDLHYNQKTGKWETGAIELVLRYDKLPEGVQGPLQPSGVRRHGKDVMGMTEFPAEPIIQPRQEGEVGRMPKGATEKRRVIPKITNHMKLGITEVEGVKTIEIIMEDGTEEGVLIGVINVATEDIYQDDYNGYEVTKKKYKMGQIIDVTFNATARNKYNVTNDSFHDLLVHALGTSVIASAKPQDTAKFHRERDAIGQRLRELDVKYGTEVGEKRLAYNYFLLAYIHDMSLKPIEGDLDSNIYGDPDWGTSPEQKEISEKELKEMHFNLSGEKDLKIYGGERFVSFWSTPTHTARTLQRFSRVEWLKPVPEKLGKRKPKPMKRVIGHELEELPKGVQGPLRIVRTDRMEAEKLTEEQVKEKEGRAEEREEEQRQTGVKPLNLMPGDSMIALETLIAEDADIIEDAEGNDITEEVEEKIASESVKAQLKSAKLDPKLAKDYERILLMEEGMEFYKSVTEEGEGDIAQFGGTAETQNDIDDNSSKESKDNMGCPIAGKGAKGDKDIRDLNQMGSDLDEL